MPIRTDQAHLRQIQADGASSNFPGSEYTPEELAFMQAMDRYKRVNRRPFPHWSEVLLVIAALGYRRVAEPEALPTVANRPKRKMENNGMLRHQSCGE